MRWGSWGSAVPGLRLRRRYFGLGTGTTVARLQRSDVAAVAGNVIVLPYSVWYISASHVVRCCFKFPFRTNGARCMYVHLSARSRASVVKKHVRGSSANAVFASGGS